MTLGLKNISSEIKNELKDKSKQLFEKKNELINTILFLNTAFSLIDTIFQQEVSNAEIKKKYKIRFLCKDLLDFFCCNKYSKKLTTKLYINPEDSGGDILKEIFWSTCVNKSKF